MSALQIQPMASRVVAYRSCAAFRCFLHGFLTGPMRVLLVERQAVSEEVEPPIQCKWRVSFLKRDFQTCQVLIRFLTIAALRVTFLLCRNLQAGS